MEHKLVIGISSFGMSGKIFHAPIVSSNKKYFIKRIIERSKNEAHALYPNALISRSFDDLLNDHEIELILVNTPDQTHFELAKKCLEAGKHVLVEKPFTQSVEQGRELIDLSKQKGKILSVFQNRRWDGDFLTIQKIIRSEILGRLVDFESHFDRYRPIIQFDSWKEQAEARSGVLYNLGSHMIDQALVLFGMPEAITAHLKIMRTGGTIDDWYDIYMHYPAVNVNLKASLLVKEPGPRYILHGTLGSFLKYGCDPQEEMLKHGKNLSDTDWGRESEEWWGTIHIETNGVLQRRKYETLPGNYSPFYDALYDCIVYGRELPVKPEEALNVIRVIEAVRESNKTLKTVFLSDNG
jgi:scyllo-inositol 2-dehydrogenase (NADP+)